MKRFTVALSLVAILALSACAQGVSKCEDRTAGCNADATFSRTMHK